MAITGSTGAMVAAINDAASTAITTIDSNVDSILTDTGTTIPAAMQQVSETASIEMLSASSPIALFTVTGVIQIISITGFITETFSATTPDNVQLTAGPGSQPLCGVKDVANDAANGNYIITGTVGDAMALNTAGVMVPPAIQLIVGPGNISVVVGDNAGDGQVQWTLVWKPMSSTAAVAVA